MSDLFSYRTFYRAHPQLGTSNYHLSEINLRMIPAPYQQELYVYGRSNQNAFIRNSVWLSLLEFIQPLCVIFQLSKPSS